MTSAFSCKNMLGRQERAHPKGCLHTNFYIMVSKAKGASPQSQWRGSYAIAF